MNFVVNIKNLSLSLRSSQNPLKIFLLSFFLGFASCEIYSQQIQNFPDSEGKNSIWIDDPGQIYRHSGSGIRIAIHAKLNDIQNTPHWKGFYIYAEGMGCMSNSEITFFLEKNVQITLQASDESPCPEWSSFEISEEQMRDFSHLEVEGILIVNLIEGTVWADSPADSRYWIKMSKGLKKVRNKRLNWIK